MTGYDNYATVDLNRRDYPNQLFIEDALDDDNSVARLSSKTMEKLELFCGDAVKLKGKKRRETICIALSDDSCRDDRIRVNHVVQNNLRVHSDDVISTQECQQVKYGTRIHVLPIDDTAKDIVGDLLQEYLQPYFRDNFRPVYVGDTFIVRTAIPAVEFKVIATEPSPYCIVAPETVIHCEGKSLKREEEDTLINEIGFDDIGGLNDVKQRLKELIQYSIEYQEIYSKFGMVPSRGVLLYGPPGCGKTMLAQALANECDVNFISVNAPELLNMSLGGIEDNVRNIFDTARQTAPCVLLINDLDCVFKIRHGNMNHENVLADRLINQMITEIDGIGVKSKVFIIGTTNRPDMIDRTILRPGRLDQAIYVPLPDEKSRQAILKIALQKWTIAKDVDLTYLAKVLSGLNGADIVRFCRGACASAVRESIEKEQKMEPSNPSTNSVLEIRQDHFEKAMEFFPRCFPSDNNILKCEIFAQMWQSSYDFASSFHIPIIAQNINEGGVKQEPTVYTDDDDLYA